MEFTLNDIGCWVDGVRGIYAGQYAIEIAQSEGFEIPKDFGQYDCYSDSPDYDDLVDCATEYLNSLCDDSVYFAWIEGDLMLIRVNEDQDDLIGVYA